MLDAQAFRAIRVIIDIGLHLHLRDPDGQPARLPARRALGAGRGVSSSWSQNCSTDEPTLRFELDRYLGWPGQAAAYKVGERIWLEARDGARRRHGADFDLRALPRRCPEPRTPRPGSAARANWRGSDGGVLSADLGLGLAGPVGHPAVSRTGSRSHRLRGRRGTGPASRPCRNWWPLWPGSRPRRFWPPWAMSADRTVVSAVTRCWNSTASGSANRPMLTRPGSVGSG